MSIHFNDVIILFRYSYDHNSHEVTSMLTAKLGARRFRANNSSIVQVAAATDTQEAVDLGGSGWLTKRLLGALVRSKFNITVRQLVSFYWKSTRTLCVVVVIVVVVRCCYRVPTIQSYGTFVAISQS